MIRAILIDDEKNALEVLEMQLKEYCKDVQIIALANGGEKGIESINKYLPELVFLDIEMPHKNGFDVLQETKDLNYQVIFTTAYDQFAIKAFKYSALDYLLKPIDILELQAAVSKVRANKQENNLNEKVDLFFQKYKSASKDLIALPVGEAMQVLHYDEIIRCESESNYTHIHLRGGKKIMVAKTLKEIQETLNGLVFLRVHQSHLINMHHIKEFYKGEGAYLIMDDGSNIAVSRSKKDEFMEQFRRI